MTEVAARRPDRPGGSAGQDDRYGVIVAGLRETFASGRTRDRAWRERQLDGMTRLLGERAGDLTAALEADLRRSPFEARLFDIAPTSAEVRHARARLRRWMRPRRVPPALSVLPGRAWYQYEPAGVVGIIAPWNYPVHLALAPLAGALAAGNCAVVKPSELTPASSALLAGLLPRYLDDAAVAVVEGGAEASHGLLDQSLDHCFFTGSPAVGRAVMAAAAAHLTPVTLELGGKCPVIVGPSARVDVAARRIAFGKLVNSGQTCVAPDYVLVDRRVRDDFVTAITAAMRRFSQGRAMPVVNERHAARLAALLGAGGIDPGGSVSLGGAVDVTAATADPTVIVDPDPDAPLMREEIFGPVLPVVTVDSVDEAVAAVRRGGRPLASYLFSEDRRDERAVLDGIVSGGTVVNHVMVHLAVSALPFGGTGTSGMGRYHGRWGFETFSNARAVVRKPSRPDPALFYPPYSGLAQRIMNRLL